MLFLKIKVQCISDSVSQGYWYRVIQTWHKIEMANLIKSKKKAFSNIFFCVFSLSSPSTFIINLGFLGSSQQSVSKPLPEISSPFLSLSLSLSFESLFLTTYTELYTNIDTHQSKGIHIQRG